MTIPKPTDIGREFVYPLTNLSVLFSWLFLFLVVEFALGGGLLGVLLLLLILPAFFRYVMRILDARARGADPGPLNVDDILWFGNAWSLFIIVHVALMIYTSKFVGGRFGVGPMLAANTLLAAVYPASLAVLAITRNPLECLTPRSVVGVISRCGTSYWLLPTYLVIGVILIWWLNAQRLSEFVVELIAAHLFIAFFALTGAIMRPQHLHDEVMIHDPVEPDQERLDQDLLKERTGVLNHAYGFISRDNRSGGFKHIRDWLDRDPEPDGAWGWFFDQMLRWENTEPALVFGQTYLSRLLHDGDYAAAVKVMTRCLHVNAGFKPLPDDRPLAIKAAEHCHNDELLNVL